jgi:hypothetical protein
MRVDGTASTPNSLKVSDAVFHAISVKPPAPRPSVRASIAVAQSAQDDEVNRYTPGDIVVVFQARGLMVDRDLTGGQHLGVW